MTVRSPRQSHRGSFASRISIMFDRHRVQTYDAESARATTTFEVPLFLSPTRYQPPHVNNNEHCHEEVRPQSSIRSLDEPVASVADRLRAHSLLASSRYSSPRSSPTLPQPTFLPFHETSLISSIRSTEDSTVSRQATKNVRHQQRRRRRRSSIKMKVQSLTRLSAAFGITLLITLIIYLVLAVANVASGIMFHVVMILLILSLTGVFAHSTIRLFVCSKLLKEKSSRRQREDQWHQQRGQQDGSYFGEIHANTIDNYEELAPEKPIRITMAEDEEVGTDGESEMKHVQMPPPVYGNYRSSKRINPNLVHWHKVPPSPLTPTYDEAMSEVHHAVGYRPPSYVESDSGASHIVEQGRHDVDQALKNIHPLEREDAVDFRQNMI